MRRLLPILAAMALLAACSPPVPQPAAPRPASRPRTGSRRASSSSSSTASAAAARWRCRRASACGERPRRCARNPRVAYAEPNYVATASATDGPDFVLPNDPGTLDGATEAAASAGDWTFKQWNFLALGRGRDAAAAGLPRRHRRDRRLAQPRRTSGGPGPKGSPSPCSTPASPTATTGRKFVRSPDFAAGQFVKGYDFIDDDRLPLDENGHGTHVAGTIAEKTDNGVGLTGLAYRAKLMPVRVLDKHGRGQASDIAKGIRFAVAHHAQVINMSFNFGCGKKVPEVDEALREAYARGVVAVASAGNIGSETCVSEPATGPRVIAVGGTTEGGCLGDYSLAGTAIDLRRAGRRHPGRRLPLGLGPADLPGDAETPARPANFAIPGNYVGTSMAAAHVSGVAAMVLAADTYGGPRSTRKPARRQTRASTASPSACAAPPAASACRPPSRAPA